MNAMRPLYLILLLGATAFASQEPKTPRAPAGAYEVSGRVVNALTSEPLAGATVNLSVSQDLSRPRLQNRGPNPSSPSEIAPVTTGSDGCFVFSGLRPGKYSLSAAKRGFGQQLYEQHEQFSSAIIVGPDKVSTDLTFRLRPDASVRGRIVDEHSEPVANAQVMLFREGIQNGRHAIYRTQVTQSSDEGVYRFAHISPGKFYIAVSATPWYAQFMGGMRGRRPPATFVSDGDGGTPGQPVDDGSAAIDVAYPITFYPGVTDSGRAETLDLKAGQRETVDFTLMAMPSLHVRVTTSTSDPGQSVNPTLIQEIFDSPDFGQRGRNMSSNQGVTEISGITAGHYLLQLYTNGQNRGGRTSGSREIDITGNVDLNASDMPPGVNIAGTVKFDGPAPSDTTRLVLRHRFNQGQVPLQVGADGTISSEQPVSPDTYEVFLPTANYQITQIAVSGARLKGQSIQVGSSDVKLNIVAAKSSARIDGIALKDGKPQAGAMVVLVPQDMERPLLYRRDQSDSDGSFALNAVTPGKYTLIAVDNWGLEWSKPEVLKPLLAAGATIQVAVDGTYKQDVNIQ